MRQFTSVVAFLTFLSFSVSVFGQRGANPNPSPTPTTNPGMGTIGPNTNPNPNTIPNRNPNPQTQQPGYDMTQRPIFLSGKVVMDDGTPPPDSVVIETVCGGGNARPQAYTDSKGHFQFQLGQNTSMMADASVADVGPMGNPNYGGRSGQQQLGGPSSMNNGSFGMGRDLTACDLRASLAGYRSEAVNLAGHRFMDNPDIGTIIMHRLGNVEGSTVSLTSLQAPKDAKKAYDKGKDYLKKKKPEEAQKEFQKAVDSYPRYAAAWFELGRLQEQQKQIAEAQKSYTMALEADKKYLNPYLPLAMIAAQQQDWKGLADVSSRLLKLDPVDYPHVWYMNSAANYNLKNYDEAEKSAREAQKLDTQHKNPKIEQLLGLTLIEKHDYPGAAEQLRNYLQFAPSAPDAAQVRGQLSELDKVNGGEAKQ